MASRQQLDKTIERMLAELRGLIDTDSQGFMIAVNDGGSSTVCATGKVENLVPVVKLMATDPAMREVFERAAVECSNFWPGVRPDNSGAEKFTGLGL